MEPTQGKRAPNDMFAAAVHVVAAAATQQRLQPLAVARALPFGHAQVVPVAILFALLTHFRSMPPQEQRSIVQGIFSITGLNAINTSSSPSHDETPTLQNGKEPERKQQGWMNIIEMIATVFLKREERSGKKEERKRMKKEEKENMRKR